MKKRHYLFDNPSNLFMVRYELRKKYPDITTYLDLEVFVLTIESKNVDIDEDIHNLIERGGGFLVQNKPFF